MKPAPEVVNKKPFPKMDVPASSWDAARKRELGLIHMAKAHLGLSREDYEFVIGAATGTKKTSAGDLTHGERNLLLQHFNARASRSGRRRAHRARLARPSIAKLRAMWYALADVDAVERPEGPIACDRAVEAWAMRQANSAKVDRSTRCASPTASSSTS